MKQTNLSSFSTQDFDKGASRIKQIVWYYINIIIVNTSWMPLTFIKVGLLRLFGAKIGKGIVIKNKVNIKFPWKLVVGDNVWLGENVWVDNLDYVIIGSNVCVSQAAMLLTGNHDYTIPEFSYRNAPVVLEDGVWIGAKSVVCPNITAYSHSILAVGSVATKSLEPYMIYQGNPAQKIRNRKMK